MGRFTDVVTSTFTSRQELMTGALESVNRTYTVLPIDTTYSEMSSQTGFVEALIVLHMKTAI